MDTLGKLSLHVAPVSGMIAPARCDWTPLWSEGKECLLLAECCLLPQIRYRQQ